MGFRYTRPEGKFTKCRAGSEIQEGQFSVGTKLLASRRERGGAGSIMRNEIVTIIVSERVYVSRLDKLPDEYMPRLSAHTRICAQGNFTCINDENLPLCVQINRLTESSIIIGRVNCLPHS